jgi:CHAD domain-containing protein
MADTILAPGASPANLSRRQLLSGATAAPMLMLPAAPPDVQAWHDALAAYRAARDRAECFYRAHLKGRSGLTPAIAALEDQLGDIEDEATGRLEILTQLPAPDLRAFRMKLKIGYRAHYIHDADDRRIIGAWLRDARRLM